MHNRVKILLFISLLVCVSFLGTQDVQGATRFGQIEPDTPIVYLPIVTKGIPSAPDIFGAEIITLRKTETLSRTVEANVTWVRNYAFSWKDIEPVRTDPPTYQWSKVNEVALERAASRGLILIATVKYTPDWAQMFTDKSCGPIREDALEAFAEFMTALVERYGQQPFNILYWEIGNEPDVDPTTINGDSGFGCWGDKNDEYFGGGYYAEMLKHVYPAVKDADPKAQILNGGLLLDCDPTNPPPGKNCLPAKFLEGILENGGGAYLDIVSFHGYAPWTGSLAYDENYIGWSKRGGVVLGKIDFLREVLAAYSVDKPLMITESGLTGATWPIPPEDFLEDQADYVIWLFVRNWAKGLMSTVWYSMDDPGWRSIGLLDINGDPKPAYQAYQYLTQRLASARYIKEVTQYTYLRGYEFTTDEKTIWVLWSPDQLNHIISLPDDVLQIHDKYGNTVPVSFNQITVNSPIYIELDP